MRITRIRTITSKHIVIRLWVEIFTKRVFHDSKTIYKEGENK